MSIKRIYPLGCRRSMSRMLISMLVSCMEVTYEILPSVTNRKGDFVLSKFQFSLSAFIVAILQGCATYTAPSDATSHIRFVGGAFAYIDHGQSCKTRDRVDRDLWSNVPIRDGARIWVEQGVDTTGLAFGFKCVLAYSFVPEPNTEYVSEYSMSYPRCNITIHRLTPYGTKVPERSAQKESPRFCML